MDANRSQRSWVAFIGFLSTVLFVQAGWAQPDLPDFTGLVERHGNTIVSIETETEARAPASILEQLPIPEDSPFFEYFERFFDQLPESPPDRSPGRTAFGSGFIISPDGYILTNAHVVAGGGTVRVGLWDGRELTAEIVGRDKPSDMAVLKVDATDLPVANIGRSADLEVGEWVVAIGAPFGLENTATVGIISALGRSLPTETYVPFIQTDTAVNPGNSGGPLFNAAGEVIGVNSVIYTGTGGYMGVSFAIPIDVAMDVARQLRETGKVTRGWLGVALQEVTRDLARAFGLDTSRGALVSQVEPRSPAAEAGIRPGDVIVAFNEDPLQEVGELAPRVARVKPGTSVPVTVVREGERTTLKVTVGELPEEEPAREAADKPEGTPRLNIQVAELPADLEGPGVLVERVGPGPGVRAGIRPGDIIARVAGRPITSVAEFRKAASEMPAGTPVAFLIKREDRALFVAVTAPEAGGRSG